MQGVKPLSALRSATALRNRVAGQTRKARRYTTTLCRHDCCTKLRLLRCARNGFREFCSRRAAPHSPSRDSVTLSDPLPPILRFLFGRFPPLAAGTARQAHRCEQWEAQRTATAAPELNARSPVPPGNCCMHSRPGPANEVWFAVLGTHNGSTIVASRHWYQPVLCCAFACTATNAPGLTRAPWCDQAAIASIPHL